MEGVLRKGRLSALVAGRSTEKRRALAGLMASMLRIGLIGFGGGNALIPVIEAEVVKGRRLITERDYQEDVVAASITPGALPVEIAAGTGQRVAGSLGMILAAVAMALPGALLLVGILSFLSGEQAEAIHVVRALSIPIGAFIMSLLLLYTVKALRAEAQAKDGSWQGALAITLAIFLLTGEANVYKLLGLSLMPFFGLSTLKALGLSFFLILFFLNDRRRGRIAVGAALSLLFALAEGKSGLPLPSFLAIGLPWVMTALAAREAVHSFGNSCESGRLRTFLRGAAEEGGAWLAFLAVSILPILLAVPSMADFVARGYFSSLISFGGGDAYLTIADGLFVATGILPEAVFFGLLVPLVNVLPGSILCKMLTGIGFVVGSAAGGTLVGLFGAVAGFAVSVSGSGLLFGLVARLIRTYREQKAFQAISRWIRPIIGGLLINVALSLFHANAHVASSLALAPYLAEALTLIVLGSSLYLLLVRHTAPTRPMLLAGAVGIILSFVY